MMDLSIVLVIALLLAGVLVWLLLPRRKPSRSMGSSLPSNPVFALPTAKHCAYFPQIQQALSAADSQYLAENAPAHIARRAIQQRRVVAKRFLKGLREDFSNLARQGRVIAALSPSVSREQETERLILHLKFNTLYALVWLRLSSGTLPLQQLKHLTQLVERLATRMEEAMSEISALPAGRLPGGLNA